VEKLLVGRYKIGLEDFFSIKCGWESKSSYLLEVATEANVDINSVCFVDDNPGEILQVLKDIPNFKHFVYAGISSSATRKTLEYSPGIQNWSKSDVDRGMDILANTARKNVREKVSNVDEYLQSIGAIIEVNLEIDVSRAAEMSKKTNQFNLSLSRLSDSEWLKAANLKNRTVQVRYKDDYGDSGIVLSALCEISKNLTFIELVMSCRVLGRGVENIVIQSAIFELARANEARVIDFRFRKGARNVPMINWLQENTSFVKNEEHLGIATYRMLL
jgi:FkbH-like protein